MGHRSPSEVGVEEHPGGVDHWTQEVETQAFGPVARRPRIAGGNGGAGRVDQQRMGKTDVGQLAGQGVDRGRTHGQTLNERTCLSIRLMTW